MKAYYINLERHLDRRQHMERELNQANFTPTRVAGVDLDNVTYRRYKELMEHVSPTFKVPINGEMIERTPHQGEIGCMFAHIKALQAVATGDAKYGLILEDDIVILGNASELVTLGENNGLDGFPEWDIINLTWNSLDLETTNYPQFYRMLPTMDKNFGLFAYMVTKRMATLILSNLPQKMDRPFDEYIKWNYFYNGLYDCYFYIKAGATPSPFCYVDLVTFNHSDTAGMNYNIESCRHIDKLRITYHGGHRRIENSPNTLYYGTEGEYPEAEELLELLHRAFPDHALVHRNHSPHVILASFWTSVFPKWNHDSNVPYLWRYGEPKCPEPWNTNPTLFLTAYLEGGSLYLPFIYNPYLQSQPIKNKNIPPRFLAYCASNKVEHRETAFRLACSLYPDECYALGKCSHETEGAQLDLQGGRFKDVDYGAYRFVLAYENTKKMGYLTEKPLIAAYQGAIPIYWGGSDTARKIFHPDRIIYVEDYDNLTDLFSYCYNMSNDEYRRRMSNPVITNEGREFLESLLDHNAHQIKEFIGEI